MASDGFLERNSCPVCEGGGFAVLLDAPMDAGPIFEYLDRFYEGRTDASVLALARYVLCECDQCRSIFQKFIPNPALMQRIYEQWIDPEEGLRKHEKSDDLNYYSVIAQEVMQLLAFVGGSPKDIKLLDFGMGWGRWARMAGAFGCDAHGAELSMSRKAYAAGFGVKAVEYEEIPKSDFDLINTEQVFEHVAHPIELVFHLSKGLRPGGYLKISVPTANDIRRRLNVCDWKAPKGSQNSLNPVAPLEHINCFNRRAIESLGRLAGLEPVTIPLRTQYRFTTAWDFGYRTLKNLLLPIYQDVFRKRNYVLLKKSG
jgi:SAM-dependent methyltransferase